MLESAERRLLAPFPGILVLNHLDVPTPVYVAASDINSVFYYSGLLLSEDLKDKHYCAVNATGMENTLLIEIPDPAAVKEIVKVWSLERMHK